MASFRISAGIFLGLFLLTACSNTEEKGNSSSKETTQESGPEKNSPKN